MSKCIGASTCANVEPHAEKECAKQVWHHCGIPDRDARCSHPDGPASIGTFEDAAAFASAAFARDADPEGAAFLAERESKPDYPNTRDCSHGSLRRSCELCERDARIAELEAECERLRARSAENEQTLSDVRQVILKSGPPQWGEMLEAVGLRIVDSDGMEIRKFDADAELAGAIVSLAAIAAGKG
jgi:hypothetical protein